LADIDFEKKSMSIKCVKTNRHKGKERRFVPVFRSVLDAANKVAAAEIGDASEPVFPMFQKTGMAIRNRHERACRSVEIVMWPKPFVNFRASCERDLFDAGFSVDAGL